MSSRTLLIFAGVFFSPFLSAETQPPALTLEDCVHRALERNFSIAASRYDVANARETQSEARAEYDPTLKISSGRTAIRSEATDVLSHTDDTRASVSQKLPIGTRVEVSSRLGRNDLSPDTSLLGPAYDADVTVALTQPLLKGFGPSANLAALRRSKIGTERARHEFDAAVLDVVRDTELAFNRLVFSREQLAVQKLSLQAAETLLSETRQRKETGVATNLDALTAEVGAANARRNVLLAEQQVADRADALRKLIGQFELDTPLGAATFSAPEIHSLDISAIGDRALKSAPEYLAARAAVEQREVDLRAARNARLPALDLGAAAGYNTDARSSGSDALSDLRDGDSYLWQLGVTLTYPIGQRGDAAQLRFAKNSLAKQETLLRQLEQTIQINVRAAVRSVETNVAAVAAAALTEKLGTEQYTLEKARYDAGLSTSRRVLDAQRDLDEARSAHLQSQVALQEALISLRRIEGSTLERYPEALSALKK